MICIKCISVGYFDIYIVSAIVEVQVDQDRSNILAEKEHQTGIDK